MQQIAYRCVRQLALLLVICCASLNQTMAADKENENALQKAAVGLLAGLVRSVTEGDSIRGADRLVTKTKQQLAKQEFEAASLSVLKSAKTTRGAVGVRSPEFANLLNFAGYVHSRSGKNDNAIRLFEAGLGLYYDNVGPITNDYFSGLANYLRLLIEAGHLDTAEVYWQYNQKAYATLLKDFNVPEKFQTFYWRTTLVNDGLLIYRLNRSGAFAKAEKYRAGAVKYCLKIRPQERQVCQDYSQYWQAFGEYYKNGDQESLKTAFTYFLKFTSADERMLELYLLSDVLPGFKPDAPLTASTLARLEKIVANSKAVGNMPLYSLLEPSIHLSNKYVELNELDQALHHAKFAARISRTSLSNNLLSHDRNLKLESKAFERWVLLSNISSPPDKNDVEDQFTFSQILRAEKNAALLKRLTSRLASREDDLGRMLTKWDDLSKNTQVMQDKANQIITTDYFKNVIYRQNALDSYRDEQKLLTEMRSKFSNVSDIVNPRPLGLKEARKYLQRKEALLHFYQTQEGYIYSWWIDDKKATTHYRKHDTGEVRALTKSIRSGLTTKASGQNDSFDKLAAHRLYEILLAPYEKEMSRVDHIFIVPDGDLQQLPFNVLRTQAANTAPRKGSTGWFGLDQAYSTIPAPSTLRVLRGLATKDNGESPFAGFGDPLLEGTLDQIEALPTSVLFRGEVANLKDLRRLPPLPNTKRELRQIAATLGGESRYIYTGKEATESRVKEVSLKDFSVLAFATHGLLGGSAEGYSEPGLVFTAPQTASRHDDGYLSTSEIAGLRTNASWVILSACNTATSEDGAAPGLNSLANAFFLSGSRGLLATHWQVQSDAAELLTTTAFATSKKKRGMRMSEAMRLSMGELAAQPQFSHPFYWAPFAVVGGGIAAK